MSETLSLGPLTSELPSAELRWVKTDTGRHRLQQKWYITTYLQDQKIKQDEEWREVPRVED